MLKEAVMSAAGRVDVRQAVARIYADLQTAIDARKPKCSSSGRCCRFDEFGHRLYVTTIELAAFVGSMPGPAGGDRTGGGCPFQVDGLCSVHTIRPFGCRIFFCEPGTEDWQHEQYERLHADLKQLHETLEVRYFYLEWRQALKELGLMPESGPPIGPETPSGRLSLRQLRL